MKEMIYRDNEFPIVLDKGNINGFSWFILSLGRHPTAYVGIPKGHKFFGKFYDDINIGCHGGLTFCGDDFGFNPIKIKDIWWIGWDYAHAGDYMGYHKEETRTKKWTTEEIKEEVMNVIKQLRCKKWQTNLKV